MYQNKLHFAVRSFLIISVILLLAACQPAAPPVPSKSPAATEAPVVTEAPAAEEYMPTVGKITTEDYKPEIRPAKEKYTFGFANYMRAAPFCVIVEDGMNKYAQEAGIDLFVVDNEANAEKAVTNAQAMITKGVDFFIEYQGVAA